MTAPLSPDATTTTEQEAIEQEAIEQEAIEQEARLAYQAYRDALHLAFPMDWEKVPAATQHAWRAVVLAMRLYNTEGSDHDI